jgi:hypothetical protein
MNYLLMRYCSVLTNAEPDMCNCCAIVVFTNLSK